MKKALLFALCTSFYALPTQADEYHYNNLLIGKNAVGLGGAFLGVADDLSTLYYNPAGLTQVGDSNMASINTFAWEKTTFNNVFGDDSDFVRSSFSVVPGFFGISHATENWTFGAALMVTDYSRERSDDEVFYQSPAFAGSPASNNNEFITIDIDNSAYQIIGAAATKLNDKWSFGASLGLEYRTFQTTQASGTVIATPISADQSLVNGFQASARFTDDNLIVIPAISLFYKDDNFSVGSKLSQSVVVNRDHQFISSFFITGIPPQVPNVLTAFRTTLNACCKQKYPINLGIGGAYNRGNWLFSADINYFTKVDQNIERLTLIEQPITKKLKALSNYAFGVSYSINDTDKIKMGFFTDNANSDIDVDVDFQRLEKIDLKGISLAFDTSILELPFSFGMYYKYGNGNVRTADTRTIDSIVGLQLYPTNNENDVAKAKKQTFVAYFSVNF